MSKKLLSLLCLLLMLTTGCMGPSPGFTLRITPPKSELPLSGTWEITALLGENEATQPAAAEWVGSRLYFTADYALLGTYLLPRPRYQVKRVDSDTYLAHNPAFPAAVPLPPEMTIITLTDNRFFACELFPAGTEELLLQLFGNSYTARRLSPAVNPSVLNTPGITGITDITALEDDTACSDKRSGILLGLRAADGGCRTLWLAAAGQELGPLLELKGIIFPRRRGFYRLEAVTARDAEDSEELLLATPLFAPAKTEPAEDPDIPLPTAYRGTVTRSITYIGNDYVSVLEHRKPPPSGGAAEERYAIFAVDALPFARAVSLSDLIDSPAATQPVPPAGSGRRDNLLAAGDSVGLARKKGYWIFQGRTAAGETYPLGLIPPDHVVFYNELSVPWPRIKNKVPRATDALTSPNDDLALVFTENEIQVFATSGRSLAGSPRQKIPLQPGEEIIMAEWALGHYVDNWTKTLHSILTEEVRP
ncbi:MAG TPA: hypothetical protein GX699_10675 [Firmicutes bacterium]|nr:hypothetical protein [Bacillota bacterium]